MYEIGENAQRFLPLEIFLSWKKSFACFGTKHFLLGFNSRFDSVGLFIRLFSRLLISNTYTDTMVDLV